MVKESANQKLRPKSVYDNVQYNPDSPPSWQYYRCMAVVIKVFELIFSLLVFLFAVIWVQARKPENEYGPSLWVLLVSIIACFVTIILFLFLVCCVICMVNRLTTWFCFEFFLHIFMIILWVTASMVSICYAVMYPEYYIICACVFSFFAQLMYSVDCNMQFVYWRESKRRDIYKHSQPLFADQDS